MFYPFMALSLLRKTHAGRRGRRTQEALFCSIDSRRRLCSIDDARRNCSNIGVAQIVAASWSNNQPPSAAAAAKVIYAAASSAVSVPIAVGEDVHKPPFLTGDGSVAIHAGSGDRTLNAWNISTGVQM
ncbi:hypothetical protein L1987_54466 [Smallanthus sonchifolius]|uniref:Uncharacterized protein n=1 Tax=Smallanthus sonchifolius TaxID=185202 RepID=A0ACB9E6U7_9ASTR|nr:hypothetical protein L1987_54466 [Smallanthus sonchifolius]